MKAIRIVLALVPIVALGACVAPSAPPPAPPPAPAPVRRPAPPPPPPVSADWRDAPQTPGTWNWRSEGGRSVARYGVPGSRDVARLSCDRAAQSVVLWREGAARGAPLIAVTATSARKLINATPAPTGGAAASLTPRDPLLDAMAFSRGRFMLEMPGAATLYLPSWPELSRVIEDCR